MARLDLRGKSVLYNVCVCGGWDKKAYKNKMRHYYLALSFNNYYVFTCRKVTHSRQ